MESLRASAVDQAEDEDLPCRDLTDQPVAAEEDLSDGLGVRSQKAPNTC
jgi:hypothetical protein